LAKIPQFYGPSGVPLVIEADLDDPVVAWHSHRVRVRGWLDALPDSEWGGPTRCESWDTTALVRHMASASQFLGYTLHQAIGGQSTSLLQGMDTRLTVEAAAASLGDLTPIGARELLAAADAAADAALIEMSDSGRSEIAEAPPGQLPAHLAVSHFLFDSWVHEYDLMLPRGERPVLNPLEAEVVMRYLIGLAVVATGCDTPLDLRMTEPDLRIGVYVGDGMVTVVTGSAPAQASVIVGPLVDVVNRTTGRQSAPIGGDDSGLAVLDGFGELLAT
jgi:uncharacterized protein (TIGR03083 family)